MAITKYATANWTDVYNVLHDNATEYFDTVTLTINNVITCTVDGVEALLMGVSNPLWRIRTKSGYSASANTTGDIPSFVVVTSKGILIHSNPGSSSASNPDDIFICKTDAGTLAFVVIGVRYGGVYYYDEFYSIDFENSPNCKSFYSQANAINGVRNWLSPIRSCTQKTSFAKIPCVDYPSTVEGVYQLTATEYPDTYGVITDENGKEYYTNGSLALEE